MLTQVFPIPAKSLLPHAEPMCCIDFVLAVSTEGAQAELFLAPGHILLAHGVLSSAGVIELAAQTGAAMQGYLQKSAGLPPQIGMLVGAQDFRFHAMAREGDTLRIAVALVGSLEGVSVFSATVSTNEQMIAQGKFKVFLPEG